MVEEIGIRCAIGSKSGVEFSLKLHEDVAIVPTLSVLLGSDSSKD